MTRHERVDTAAPKNSQYALRSSEKIVHIARKNPGRTALFDIRFLPEILRTGHQNGIDEQKEE